MGTVTGESRTYFHGWWLFISKIKFKHLGLGPIFLYASPSPTHLSSTDPVHMTTEAFKAT